MRERNEILNYYHTRLIQLRLSSESSENLGQQRDI